MSTIRDYIEWRSDLSFQSSPICELDNYIIAVLCTLDFEGIVPDDDQEIRLEDAFEKYLESHGEQRLGVLVSERVLPMIKSIYHSDRYKDLKLCGYINHVQKDLEEQCAAMTVRVPDGPVCITFRATDDTIAGWKENFYLALKEEIPAQQDALQYLKRMAALKSGPIIVSGHSKGGNLSVFAAAKADPPIQDRIIKVYSFDGPGFLPDFLKSAGYLRIRDKIEKIIPDNSLVGVLLCHDGKISIVGSTIRGAVSHDGLTWQVWRNGFVHTDSLTKQSALFNETIDSILLNMEYDEIKDFVDELFDTLSVDGAVTLTDALGNGAANIGKIGGKLLLEDKKVHNFVHQTIHQLINAYVIEGIRK